MTPSDATVAFGLLVRKLREEAGLTQDELAEKADCGSSSISTIERAKRGASLDMVMKLARGLDRSAWTLVREVERRL